MKYENCFNGRMEAHHGIRYSDDDTDRVWLAVHARQSSARAGDCSAVFFLLLAGWSGLDDSDQTIR